VWPAQFNLNAPLKYLWMAQQAAGDRASGLAGDRQI
jgi:hypothetical protein